MKGLVLDALTSWKRDPGGHILTMRQGGTCWKLARRNGKWMWTFGMEKETVSERHDLEGFPTAQSRRWPTVLPAPFVLRIPRDQKGPGGRGRKGLNWSNANTDLGHSMHVREAMLGGQRRVWENFGEGWTNLSLGRAVRRTGCF